MKPEWAWMQGAAAALWLAWAMAWLSLVRAGWSLAPAGGRTAVPTEGLGSKLLRQWPVLLDAALVCLAVGIALRWARLGHGPFLNLFEILASSLFSLTLGWRIALVVWPALGATAGIVLSILGVMAAWLLSGDARDSHLPATYQTPVLWFHVLLGKAFLAFLLIATGIAGVVLLRGTPAGALWFRALPGDAALDTWAWRCMSIALVFESLMLVAGAVWAQDAWGRYWQWDPLETWAFITWLALAFALHARLTWRLGARTSAAMIVAVFVLAFLTFFGVPFVSEAPHKGAV
jgi:ABC-type transport system involved in cytochrome c biogenesis permease subunit